MCDSVRWCVPSQSVKAPLGKVEIPRVSQEFWKSQSLRGCGGQAAKQTEVTPWVKYLSVDALQGGDECRKYKFKKNKGCSAPTQDRGGCF